MLVRGLERALSHAPPRVWIELVYQPRLQRQAEGRLRSQLGLRDDIKAEQIDEIPSGRDPRDPDPRDTEKLLIWIAADLVVAGILEGARLEGWLTRVPGRSSQERARPACAATSARPEKARRRDAQRGIKRATGTQIPGVS